MAFHVDKRTQIHDGGVALHDTLQHGAGRKALHDVRCDVAKCLFGNRLLTLNFNTQVVESLPVRPERTRPANRWCFESTQVHRTFLGGFGRHGFSGKGRRFSSLSLTPL